MAGFKLEITDFGSDRSTNCSTITAQKSVSCVCMICPLIFYMGQPRPLFHLFSVFSNNFYNKAMLKNVQMSIQYTALGFEPTTFET